MAIDSRNWRKLLSASYGDLVHEFLQSVEHLAVIETHGRRKI